MSITLDTLDFLVSDIGSRLLDDLSHADLSESNTLPLLTRLRRIVSPQEAGAALAMARSRQKAVEKFGRDANCLFFTADALEQASDPLIRQYRATLAQNLNVLDACCGIGSDSLAFAQNDNAVLGLDCDPVRVAIARYNAAMLGVENARFEVADVRQGVPDADMIFYDPARRDEHGHRLHDVERYLPPLALVKGWQAGFILAKLSPGVELAQLARYTGGVEFISVQGDLKEALLYLGADTPHALMATLLTPEGAYHWQEEPLQDAVDLSEPRAWLVEPDPAILRAGLVQNVAAAFRGSLLDETIAYFTTDQRPVSPWLRAWQIDDWMPFHLKRLRAYLRERHVGRVTIKKRGSAVTPEELLPKLKLSGSEASTLVLTRCRGQQIVVFCNNLDAPDEFPGGRGTMGAV